MPSMRRLFNFHYLNISLTVFLLIGSFTLIPFERLSFLDPITQALNDFELYDLSFSKFKNDETADTNIVIVNIGQLSRAEIAHQIRIISSYKPKVIGIDILFNDLKDSVQDEELRSALKDYSPIILASKIDTIDYESESPITEVKSHEYFSSNVKSGYVNLPDEENSSFRTVRRFIPKVFNHDSFASQLASYADDNAVARLSERDNEAEYINYRGNYNKFYFIDFDQIFKTESDFSFLKDKIVILGYISSTAKHFSLEDIFFTPLNERYVGKTFPDMNGVVIHANIVSMILSQSYIDEMSLPIGLFFCFIIIYLNVLTIKFFQNNYGAWNDTVTNVFLVIQSLVYLFIGLLVFNEFNYKIEIVPAQAGIFIITAAIDIYELYFLKIARHLKLKMSK